MKATLTLLTLMLLGFTLAACTDVPAPPAVTQNTASQTQPSTQPGNTTQPAKLSSLGYDLTPVKYSDAELKKRLTSLEYYVTQKEGTERPFTHPYDKNYQKGTYVCIVCGLPLFSSDHKFNSRTGWPSFWQPIAADHVGTKFDGKHGWNRTEVHCARCGAHLGHVFNDGPKPTGQRWCINGASLKFVPDKE